MNRKEQEITDLDTVEAVIDRCFVCRVGVYAGIHPYIIPVNFIYSDKTVFFHSARRGKKIQCLRENTSVCVEWDIPGGLDPAGNACDYGFHYVSVIASGKAFFVESDEKRPRILSLLTSRYSGTPHTVSPEAAAGTSVVGITLDELTGKASSGEYLSAVLASKRPGVNY